MKRRLLALLLAVLTLTMLTAAVFAEDATAKGAYNLKSLDKRYTLTAADGNNDGSGFYANASTFTLECAELTGKYSLALLLQQDDNAYPTETNLYYIDQKTIEAGKATFSIIPKAMTTNGATYNVYVSTNGENGALTKVASFQYGTKPPYTLGDVNGDGKINAGDALLALLYEAQLTELDTKQMLAANVTAGWLGDDKIDANDALRILLYEGGLITSWTQNEIEIQ